MMKSRVQMYNGSEFHSLSAEKLKVSVKTPVMTLHFKYYSDLACAKIGSMYLLVDGWIDRYR